jgi:SecD/SecF fusion protein
MRRRRSRRRRTASERLVPAIVTGLVIAGCGSTGQRPATAGDATVGQPGVDLVYEAVATPGGPVTTSSLDRAAAVIRQRMAGSVTSGTVRLDGRRILVSLPGVSPSSPIALEIGSTGRLGFYDWEADVVNASGKIAGPDAPLVTGGSNAGSPTDGVGLYAALTRAAKRPARHYAKTTAADGTFYAVDTGDRRVLAGPALTRGQLTLELTEAARSGKRPPAGRSVVHLPAGTIVVQGETPTGAPNAPVAGYYALTDDPAVDGSEITDPKESLDNSPGGTNGPAITFGLTSTGQAAFASLTKAIARRGARSTAAGDQPNLQHFAIVVDGRVISVPAVDFTQYPNGIVASDGSEISGGFTVASARALAGLIGNGPLPISLVEVSAIPKSP